MSNMAINNERQTAEAQQRHILSRYSFEGNTADVLSDIYREETNMAIWQRTLSDKLAVAAEGILSRKPHLKASSIVSPETAVSTANEMIGLEGNASLFSEDIAQLVDMFCCLFDLRRAGLRITALDRAMCPRFHVDRVPCRLITTYVGHATEWIPHELVDRAKLGIGNQGQSDDASGLLKNSHAIHQLKRGDVALLKGEQWEGNEGAGLVHRSPSISMTARRLVLTLDFID
ncbi:DUF1826 domain-containing protein [Enterovibrio sp. FF113]|uniref:DUF1826 domain-containing protein n=1 Tax=Enterovibrio sp. FF113 TaxID=3230010 RepID=UPI00352DA4D5